ARILAASKPPSSTVSRKASVNPMTSAVCEPAPMIGGPPGLTAVAWQAAQDRPTNLTGTGVALPGRRLLTVKPTGRLAGASPSHRPALGLARAMKPKRCGQALPPGTSSPPAET